MPVLGGTCRIPTVPVCVTVTDCPAPEYATSYTFPIAPTVVIEAWDEPKHEEFRARPAWSIFNAFTDVQKGSPPRAKIEGSLRLLSLFRKELQLL